MGPDRWFEAMGIPVRRIALGICVWAGLLVAVLPSVARGDTPAPLSEYAGPSTLSDGSPGPTIDVEGNSEVQFPPFLNIVKPQTGSAIGPGCSFYYDHVVYLFPQSDGSYAGHYNEMYATVRFSNAAGTATGRITFQPGPRTVNCLNATFTARLISRPPPSSCGSTSDPDLQKALAAVLCEFTNNEQTVMGQAPAFQSLVQSLPKPVQTGPGQSTSPPTSSITQQEIEPIGSAIGFLNTADFSFKTYVVQRLVDRFIEKKLDGRLPCLFALAKSLLQAAYYDKLATDDFDEVGQILGGLESGTMNDITEQVIVGRVVDALGALYAKYKSVAQLLYDAINPNSPSCGPRTETVLLVVMRGTIVIVDDWIIILADDIAQDQDVLALAKSYETTAPPTSTSPLPNLFNPGQPIQLPGNFTPPALPPFSSLFVSRDLSVRSASTAGVARSVRAGHRLLVSGGGFAAESRVEIALISANPTTQTRKLITADSNGSFSAKLQISPQTSSGPHELYAIGTAPDQTVRALAATITVRGGHPPTRRECIGTLNGSINGTLLIPRGLPCTLIHARVGGNVIVGKSAIFEADDSTIKGNIVASRPQAVALCGDHVRGNVRITHATLPTVIGVSHAPLCTRTTISGSINVH